MLELLKSIFNFVINTILNSDYSLKSMFLGYLISKVRFNYVEIVISYLKKCVSWTQERSIDKHYNDYQCGQSYFLNFKCKIYCYFSGTNTINDDMQELTPQEMVKYENEINEFLVYYMKSIERYNTSNFTFGLTEMIDNKKIKYKIKDVQPSVRNICGSVLGVLTVISYVELTKSEIDVLSNQIENKLFDCFGESCEQTAIKISNGSLFLLFRDENFKCNLCSLDD